MVSLGLVVLAMEEEKQQGCCGADTWKVAFYPVCCNETEGTDVCVV